MIRGHIPVFLLVAFALAPNVGKAQAPDAAPAAAPPKADAAAAPAAAAPKADGKATQIPSLPGTDYPYPGGGAKIGQGWDSFNERATADSCVEVTEIPLERASYESHVEQIQSTYSLATKTTTSVSASYSGFGVGASGSLSTSSSLNINTDDQNFLFTFVSSNGSTFAVSPQKSQGNLELSDQNIKALEALKSDPSQQNYLVRLFGRPSLASAGTIRLTTKALELRKHPKDFARLCGDGFVSAVHRGGRINLLLTQKYASNASANSLSASLSASGYGASGSASYSTSTQKLNTTNNLAYRVFQEGGVPMKPAALPVLPPGANQFFDVNTILPPPDQLISNPTAFSVTVTPYEDVIEELTGEQLPSPIKLLTLSDYFLALRDEYRTVETILNGVRTSRSDPNFAFDSRMIDIYGGEKALEDLYDEIHFDLAFLENAISQCYSAARNCTVPSALAATFKDYVSQLAVVDSEQKALQQKVDAQKLMAAPADPKEREKQDAAKAALDKDIVRTAAAKKRLSALKDTGKDGIPDQRFFLKFYQYLSRTPVPKFAYAGPDFVALNKLEFQVAAPKDKAAQVAAANTGLRHAILSFRLSPWKKFFCETLNSSSMCVSEGLLRTILDDVQPTIISDNLTPIYPPPPPPPRDWDLPWRYPCGSPHFYGCL